MQHSLSLIAAVSAALAFAGDWPAFGLPSNPPGAKTAEAKHPAQGSYPEAGNFRWIRHGEAMPLPLSSLDLTVIPVRDFDQKPERAGLGIQLSQFHLEETLFTRAPGRLPRLAPLGRSQPWLPTKPHPYIHGHALAVVRHRDSKPASAVVRDKTTPPHIAYDASPFLRSRQPHLGTKLVSIYGSNKSLRQDVGGPKYHRQNGEDAAPRDQGLKEAAQALAFIIGFITAVLGFVFLITTEGALCRAIGLALLALAAWILVS